MIPDITTQPFESDADGFKEECAVFGIFGSKEAHILTALGLHALQHRGQEATGMVTYNGDEFNVLRGVGQVGENFSSGSSVLESLKGHIAIGHNRYSTTGLSEVRNIQPFLTELAFGPFALAHNGNLTNAEKLRNSLIATGSLFQSTTDTEAIIHLVARSHQSAPKDRLAEALMQVSGAYALVAVVEGCLIGVRDPLGIRPLVMGTIGDATILASETCALDIIGADYVRDIDPGEMVIISKDSVSSVRLTEPQPSRFCIFEYINYVKKNIIQLVGGLTPFYIPVTGFMVHPFIGWCNKEPSTNIQIEEVNKLFTVSLSTLLDDQIFQSENWEIRGQKAVVPFYNFEGRKVWGVTASILSEFKLILKDMKL